MAEGELNPSKLGTLEYWEQHYERDLRNFADQGDPGDAWFGEQAVAKMARWVDEHFAARKADALVLDVGCGNGHLLFDLSERGFERLVGVDYSPKAIELCRAWAEAQAEAHPEAQAVQFAVADLLGEAFGAEYAGRVDLVLDKGTYDAISLAPGGGRQQFVDVVWHVLAPDGVLLITSCNWTEDELIAAFANGFALQARIKHASFTFGGRQGQSISTCAFQRVPR